MKIINKMQFDIRREDIVYKKNENGEYEYISSRKLVGIIEELKIELAIKDKKIRQLAELDELSKRRKKYDKNSEPDVLW